MNTICSAAIALVLLWIRTMEAIGDCYYLTNFYWSDANGPWYKHGDWYSKPYKGTTAYLYQHPTYGAWVISYEKDSTWTWGWCNTGTDLLNCKGKWWYHESDGWHRDRDASFKYERLWGDVCWTRGRSEGGQPIAEPPRGTRELPPDSSKWIFEIVVNRQFMVYIGVLAFVFVIALLSIVTCYKRYTGPKVMVYDSN